MLSDYFKKKETDSIWWRRDTDYVGRYIFSFDKSKDYNLYADYRSLTKEQKEKFDKENPFWADYLNG